MNRALGKRPPRIDARTLKFARYLTPAQVPAPPPLRDWVDHTHPFDVLGNDTIGDCAFAAQAHLIQCFTAANDRTSSIRTADVLGAYSAVAGYEPGKPETDRGTVMLDALSYWRKTGIAGHKIGAYVQLEIANRMEIESAINLFGGIYVGVALPTAAKSQTIWDVAPSVPHDRTYDPGSWGGHAVACPGYSRTGLVFVTWGKLKIATWEWLATYADEIYAVLGEDWVSEAHPAPNGFDLEQLRTDLAALP